MDGYHQIFRIIKFVRKQTLNIILGRKLENNDISSKLTKTVFASSWDPTLKVIYMTE